MKKLDARTLIELILLVVAVIFWGLRKANILYIPGLAAIALAITGVLNPVVGALVHNAGSVLVIVHSALLLRWRRAA